MTQFTLPPDYGPDWNNQASRLTALRNLGFNPRRILDVGAYHGHWAGLAHWIWPKAELRLIEGSDECADVLAKKNFKLKFDIAVLSDASREMVFNKCQTGCGEGNSLFKENSVFPFQANKVRTKTLNELLSIRDEAYGGIIGYDAYDFIKIDCQGSEIDIMKGGSSIIQNAEIVLLESQIQNYNEGAPNAIDTINFMNLLGFRLYDIVDSHYNSRGMLIQVDLMFAKSTSPLFSLKVLS